MEIGVRDGLYRPAALYCWEYSVPGGLEFWRQTIPLQTCRSHSAHDCGIYAASSPIHLGLQRRSKVSFTSSEAFQKLARVSLPLYHEVLPIFMAVSRYNVLVVVGFCCGMLYYSTQVLWPRQSALLFVPADDPIMRGVYANLTFWATWSEFSDRLKITSL